MQIEDFKQIEDEAYQKAVAHFKSYSIKDIADNDHFLNGLISALHNTIENLSKEMTRAIGTKKGAKRAAELLLNEDKKEV